MRTKNRTDERGRVRRNAEQRLGLIEAYKASGLSQAEFCRREGIEPTTLNHWLRGRAKPGRTPARRKKACRFAQVQVAFPERVEAALAGPAPLEIELGTGVLIRVRDASRLKDLVEFVREVRRC
jgi:transcriptional regulator with XRE-family HTH domain